MWSKDTTGAMQYGELGELQVSVIGLGCNNFGMRLDAQGTKLVVDAAIDAGINYFDTAESYGTGLSEEYLGQAIKGRRDQVLVASKWGHTVSLAEGERGGDPAQIRARLDASLARLGTDYIDHYQLHRPDPETPAVETLGCLSELRAEGKIREIGCTHFSAVSCGCCSSSSSSAPSWLLPPPRVWRCIHQYRTTTACSLVIPKRTVSSTCALTWASGSCRTFRSSRAC